MPFSPVVVKRNRGYGDSAFPIEPDTVCLRGMTDITHKNSSLRMASAFAEVLCAKETLALIRAQALPKGNLFDVARAAGLLAAKATPSLIPHCHPIPIEHLEISFEVGESGERGRISVTVSAKTVYKTGIEIEAMTAASITALTLFDLLKPVDHSLEISGIRLLQKTGGKSDRNKTSGQGMTAAILVCSDSVSSGLKEDKSGKAIEALLAEQQMRIADYKVVPDNIIQIQQVIQDWVAQKVDFIITTGGTGLGPRDMTVEAVEPLLEKVADGIAEKMRQYGNERTPLAMFSRSLAGSIGQTLVVCLPGSSAGVKESLAAIFPAIFHANAMLRGGGH